MVDTRSSTLTSEWIEVGIVGAAIRLAEVLRRTSTTRSHVAKYTVRICTTSASDKGEAWETGGTDVSLGTARTGCVVAANAVTSVEREERIAL